MTQIIKKGMVLFMSAVMFLCCGAFDFSYVDAATCSRETAARRPS